MADLFISYNRGDREIVERLAERFGRYGVEIWFDARLEQGDPFDIAIQTQLRQAKAVLVIWTPNSIESEWVRAEATHGRERGVLLAATLKSCTPLPPFNVIQTADLREWPGNENYSEWLKLLEGLGGRIGRPGLKNYALAASSGLLLPLRDWAAQFPADPLASVVKAQIAARGADVQREEDAVAQTMAAHRQAAEQKQRDEIEREARRRQQQTMHEYRSLRRSAAQDMVSGFVKRLVWMSALAAIFIGGVWLWRPDMLLQFAPPDPSVHRTWETGEHIDANLPPGTVFQECPSCPQMVVVPASPNGSAGTGVVIDGPFAIGRYEVTRREFAAYARAQHGNSSRRYCYASRKRNNASWRDPGFLQTGLHPAVCISASDAQRYVEWLSDVASRNYRLPLDSEWEHAARAGVTSEFAYGDRLSTNLANYDGRAANTSSEENLGRPGDTSRNRTTAVGSYAPNRFGLFDVHGNVAEFTADCLAGESGPCDQATLRGGSWISNAFGLAFSQRRTVYRDSRSDTSGFRVVRDLD